MPFINGQLVYAFYSYLIGGTQLLKRVNTKHTIGIVRSGLFRETLITAKIVDTTLKPNYDQ